MGGVVLVVLREGQVYLQRYSNTLQQHDISGNQEAFSLRVLGLIFSRRYDY